MVGKDPNGLLCVWASSVGSIANKKIEILVSEINHPQPVADFLGGVEIDSFFWNVYSRKMK